MPSVRRTGARIQWADVTIRHVGYQDPGLRRAKLERDIRLLERSIADLPDEPFVLFNIGSVYVELGRMAEALPLLKRSLANSHPTDSIVRKLYALIVQCHRRLDHADNALESCRAGRALYPEDAELLFQEGLILRGIGDRSGAEARLLQLLQTHEGDHFASVDPGLRGYKARHNLAVLYQDQGRWSEAQAQWQAVTDERPDFTPAWLGLGELHLRLERWKDVEAIARRLSLAPAGLEDAAVLLARSLLKQSEFGAARGTLEQAIGRNPRALRPRVILSHVLLQEGRDSKAAETALREILALDPGNTEARHNLAILLSKSAGRA
jgi:tetratricopeptide (TPR) repeat protein